MALAAPTLAKYQEITTAGTSFVTSSWTPNVAARLYLAWLFVAGATVNAPTAVSGNGLTWSKVTNGETTAGDGNTKLGSLWMAYGTGTAGALTISMGATHTSAIVTVLEQSGVTGTSAVLQAANNRNFSTDNLAITLSAFANSANSTVAFFWHKNQSTGGATGVTPGSGFTELVEDSIATDRNVYVEYRTSADTTADMTLTGDADGVYSAYHIGGVAVEIGATVPWVGKVQIIVDIDPASLPVDDTPEVTPGVVEFEPAAPVADAQALGARPTAARGRDLPAALSSLEQRINRVEGQQVTNLGFIPALDEDPPADWPNGAMWTRSTTGDLCWRIGGVTQVLPPSTPIAEPDR